MSYNMEKMMASSPLINLKSKVPRQMQRYVPIYLMCIFVLLIFANMDFGSSPIVTKRQVKHQKLLKTPEHGSKFPRKIWQTWKVDALRFEERDSTCAKTWTSANPGYRYEVLTDANAMYFVEENFGPHGINRPDIVEVYRTLTAKIIKADLLRYLVMYVEGGIYADIDVEALRPAERFIPGRYDEGDIELVIGVEIDQPEFKDHPILGQKSQSFCQWTFMSKPGSPLMLQLVDNILDWLYDLSQKQKKPISSLDLDFDEVLTGTGPSAFTKAVLKEMSRREGREITWDSFHSLAESRVIGGILVLTVEAFAAGQGHSDSGNHDARGALVKHHYHASSWPTQHPRYKHPVYGEVERCNWNAECVKLWDTHKATFDKLTPEQQAKMITLKEVSDAQEAQKQLAAKST